MAGFSSDKPVEEEQVRTEEDDLVKTTDEEEQVRTEEADPAKTTDEEEQVRTEEADPAETTDEEERMRTNEDDPREEATESLLDSVPNISALNLDEESDERNENPQEDSTMIPRSDQPTNRGSTPYLNPLNLLRALCAPQTTNRGSTSLLTDQHRLNHPIFHQPRSRVTELPLQNPSLDQIPRSDQMMIASVQNNFNIFDAVQNNFNQPFGVPPLPTRWLVGDHIFDAGFDPNNAAWRPQIIRPLMPNQTTSPDQQHPMANQLANIAGLQDQTFVPKPLFSVSLTYYVPPQPHLIPMALSTFQYFPLMGGEANQLNMMRPHFRVDQMLTLTSPSGQPRSFLVLPCHPSDPERKCVYSLDDAVVFAPPLELNPVGPWLELNHQKIQHQNYQGPHNFVPVDWSFHPDFSNAAAPPPALNHQQTQQHQPQTQGQSPRFDAGGSSRQGQDQQQP